MGKNNKKRHSDKQDFNSVKYRLIVIQENEYTSWKNTFGPWEDITNQELDKKYRFWECQKKLAKASSGKSNGNGNNGNLNGSKLENNAKVTNVHLQVGYFDEKKKDYKWVNRNYLHSSSEFPYHMR